LRKDARCFLEDWAQKADALSVCEKVHTCIETRRIRVSARIDRIDEKRRFPGVRTLMMVESRRQGRKEVCGEQRCSQGSLPPDVELLGRHIRAHREIENSRHWVLDMDFHEDQSCVRTGHTAKTPCASDDDDYRISILFLPGIHLRKINTARLH
jgi:hypothetical protein